MGRSKRLRRAVRTRRNAAVASPKHIAVRRRDLACIQVTAGLEASAAAQWLVPWTAMLSIQ
jgi:hypothetical protein